MAIHDEPSEETLGHGHDEVAYGDMGGDEAMVVFLSVERQFLLLRVLEHLRCLAIFPAVFSLALLVAVVKVQQHLEEIGGKGFVEDADDGGLVPYQGKALPHVDWVA